MNTNIPILESELEAVAYAVSAADEMLGIHDIDVGFPFLSGSTIKLTEGERQLNGGFLHIVRLKNEAAYERLMLLIPHDEGYVADLWDTCERPR